MSPAEIKAGPDGNLWFTEPAPLNSLIGRITTDGRVTEFPRPGPISDGEAFGPDGNLWFTEGLQEKTTGTPLSNYSLSRITPAGQIIDLSLTGPAPFNADLTFGPDGNAWFTDTDGNAIGRITLSGLVAEFSIPTADTGPFGIVTGPDGNLWFNEFKAANIGRFGVATTDLGLAIPAPPVTGIAGQPLAYTISVTNHGPVKATDVVLAEKLTSAPVPVVSTSHSRTSYSASQGTVEDLPGRGFVAALGDLASGATATVTILVTSPGPQSYTTTTRLDVHANESDANPGNDTATLSVTISQGASSNRRIS